MNEQLLKPVEWPRASTSAGHAFRVEYERVWKFLTYITGLAIDYDARLQSMLKLKLILESPEDSDDQEKRGLEVIEKEGAAAVLRDAHSRLLREMLLIRAVDNFLAYVADLLTIVYRTRPEMLRSSETVTVEDVLQFQSMQDLVHHLVERRVNALSYKGLRKLSEHLDNQIKFQLFADPEARETAVRVVETRNLLVHARGIVNRTFVERVASPQIQEVGSRVRLGAAAVLREIHFLASAVADIDARAADKFGIEMHPAIPVDSEDV